MTTIYCQNGFHVLYNQTEDSNLLHHVYNSMLSFNIFQIKNVLQKADEGYKSVLLLMTAIGKYLPPEFLFTQVHTQ
jgi:hypothetical protein